MTPGGFIQLSREILDCSWYESPNILRVYLHLMLTANFRDTEWRGIVIRRGQRVCSYEKLAAELGLSLKAVRYAVEKLKGAGELAHEKTASYGVFTLLRYQAGAEPGQQFSPKGAAIEERRINKKEKGGVPPLTPRRDAPAGEQRSLGDSFSLGDDSSRDAPAGKQRSLGDSFSLGDDSSRDAATGEQRSLGSEISFDDDFSRDAATGEQRSLGSEISFGDDFSGTGSIRTTRKKRSLSFTEIAERIERGEIS